jgi:hypothetical protein
MATQPSNPVPLTNCCILATMSQLVISLDPSTPGTHNKALEEVEDFHRTDLGRGGGASWTFRALKEPELSNELIRQSGATKIGLADSVSFQPGPVTNEDRTYVREWRMPNGSWQFSAILDGERPFYVLNLRKGS